MLKNGHWTPHHHKEAANVLQRGQSDIPPVSSNTGSQMVICVITIGAARLPSSPDDGPFLLHCHQEESEGKIDYETHVERK